MSARPSLRPFVLAAVALLAAACGQGSGPAAPACDMSSAIADLGTPADLATPADADACQTCTDGACPTEKQTCFGDPACSNYVGCLGFCPPTDISCLNQCASAPGVTPAGIAAYQALTQCMDDSCMTVCTG